MRERDSKQVVGGAALSYILICLNAIYGIVLTPYLISTLGNVEYGVYKTIGSLSSSLMVMDLGIGGTVTRYIAKYRAEDKSDRIPDFLGMMFLETLGIICLVSIVCGLIYHNIHVLYGNTFSPDELVLAQRLFAVLSVNMCLTIIENVFDGIISGSNSFIYLNGIKLARLVIRIALLFLLLRMAPSALTLVWINLLLTFFGLALESVWAIGKCGARVRIGHLDRGLFKESFGYTALMLASTIINQVNGNLDNVIIGAVIGAGAVTVYSMGLTIFGMFEQLSTAISGVMLPSMTNVLHEEDGMNKARILVIDSGRAQLLLLGAAFIGFTVLGKRFVMLWLGNGFEDVYYITLILMCPSLFTATVNVSISILRAQNRLKFRTAVLLCTTVANALITYYGTKKYGYYAAAIGTAVSLIIGVIIIINIYYSKTFGFSMLDVYRDIFKGIGACAIVAGIPTAIVNHILHEGWSTFIICVAVYIASYMILLNKVGLNEKERNRIKRAVRRN